MNIPNYQNCKIYKIISLSNPELIFYGHTCNTLIQRMSNHKNKFNNCTSKKIIELGDAQIELVEDYPCNNKDEARSREAFFILNNPCINKNIPGRTPKESFKAYYNKNKEKFQIKNAKYRETHKEYHRIKSEEFRKKKKAVMNEILII